VTRPRAAEDFPTIRARLEELRREREREEAGQTEVQSDPPMRPYRSIYWPDGEPGAGPYLDRRSGPIRAESGENDPSATPAGLHISESTKDDHDDR
jgi:hypothetical protein